MKIRSLVSAVLLALLAGSIVGVSSPAQAAVTCVPGTYISPVNPDACDVAPPGTFTSVNNAVAPVNCPSGYYQPLAKASYCAWTPAGYFTDMPRSILPLPCEPGWFAPNQNSTNCDEASAQKFVSQPGSTSESDCPVISVPFDPTSVGNSHEIECYDWSQEITDRLVTPVSNSTIEHSFPIEFFVGSGVPASGTRVQIRYDSVTSSGMNWEFNTPSVLADGSFNEVVVEQPHYWTNSDSVEGCYNGCQYGIPREELPVGMYDMTIKLINNANSQVLATLTANNVTIEDTQTEEPGVYLNNRGPDISVNDTYSLSYYLPEEPVSDSVAISFRSAPLVDAGISRTYNIRGQQYRGVNQITLPLSGDPTQFSSNFSGVAGVSLTPGLWWVVVTYEDAATNSSASGMWGDPIRISRACASGFYSVDGVEACIRVPAGTYSTYPDDAGYDYDAWAHRPTQCQPGTYQAEVGFSGSECTPADAGKYVGTPGASAQTSCPVGYYQPLSGQASCLRAPANTYVSAMAASSFTRCPTNYASVAGSDSLSDCKPTACIIKKGKAASATCLLVPLAKTVPAKAKVTFTMSKSFSKICKVSGTTVKTLKAGTCTLKMTVKPKTGRTITYTVKVIATT